MKNESEKKCDYDLVVIGGGPGGYTAAIRASQLGKKVLLVEKDKLGGVCLNRGCIPTKALIKAGGIAKEVKECAALGVEVEVKALRGEVALARARDVATRVGKGVGFLMKKNGVEVVSGKARLISKNEIEIAIAIASDCATASDGATGGRRVTAQAVIVATGARYRTFPGLLHDGERLIGAFEALNLTKMPKSIAIIGAGAIGMEFSFFFNAFGTKVHIFEKMPRLLPLEDVDSSVEIERVWKKYGINVSLGLESVVAKRSTTAEGTEGVQLEIQEKKPDGSLCEKKEFEFDMALIAVGMVGNIEGIGLEEVGIKTKGGFIEVDGLGRTNVNGVWAIGDVAGPPLLAHVASHQGVIAVEDWCGEKPHPLDVNTVPGGVYIKPEVASVGFTERAINEKGIAYRTGKMPFLGNGKAIAANEKEGFVKVLLDDEGKLLGAHIVGANATELILEYTLLKSMKGTDRDVYNTIHPHPTLGEWLAEAMLLADDRAINF
ncbi:MAG: dihydrolipoyl dehydrogenase [Oligoflexia bacterium]|nr:dihydrolipoyl dehydrogenase [Oligoflexia bacterium]MBF0365324.1 dihydrolipoyl dehydrogenase [Oligoflexia bacterium]